MKIKLYTVLTASLFLFAFASCTKDGDKWPATVTLGAQENTTTGGFYAVGEDKTYTMEKAYSDSTKIDLLCFYELSETVLNYTCLASPGSGITGIFEGDYAPENWISTKLTRFFQTSLTSAEFDAIQENDALLYSQFLGAASTYKKAKNVQVGQVWAFHTADNYYGLINITAVTAGNDGSVSFDVKSMYYVPYAK
jgi:hypothetical protein